MNSGGVCGCCKTVRSYVPDENVTPVEIFAIGFSCDARYRWLLERRFPWRYMAQDDPRFAKNSLFSRPIEPATSHRRYVCANVTRSLAGPARGIIHSTLRGPFPFLLNSDRRRMAGNVTELENTSTSDLKPQNDKLRGRDFAQGRWDFFFFRLSNNDHFSFSICIPWNKLIFARCCSRGVKNIDE